MAIKPIAYDSYIKVTNSDGTIYDRTDFVCDNSTDITAANAAGSVYLKYPAGSCIYDPDGKKTYILNASRTEYKEA